MKIIELAWERVLKSRASGAIPLAESVKDMGRRFDEAYTSIYATVKE
ncbi:MAG: hypothetical protein NT082_05190 [Chloroflexi bacterium]|nr:hypothetical protein [Chloroflexota bacterium]